MSAKFRWRVYLVILLLLVLPFLIPSTRRVILSVWRGELPTFDLLILDYHISCLRHPDSAVRKEAISRISSLKQAAGPAVPALIALLKDPASTAGHRESIAITLGLIGPAAGEAVPAMAELLSDPDWKVRLRAAEELRRLGPESVKAVPALVAALRDDLPAVCVEARRSLRVVDEKALKEALTRALRDEKPRFRAEAAEGVGELGTTAKEFEPLLEPLLDDPDPRMREQATTALSSIGGKVVRNQ